MLYSVMSRRCAGHEEGMAAAQVYATVLADDGDDGAVSLGRGSHVVTRVLWQQRFFGQAMGAHHGYKMSCSLGTWRIMSQSGVK